MLSWGKARTTPFLQTFKVNPQLPNNFRRTENWCNYKFNARISRVAGEPDHWRQTGDFNKAMSNAVGTFSFKYFPLLWDFFYAWKHCSTFHTRKKNLRPFWYQWKRNKRNGIQRSRSLIYYFKWRIIDRKNLHHWHSSQPWYKLLAIRGN